jgi:hypothetical protein
MFIPFSTIARGRAAGHPSVRNRVLGAAAMAIALAAANSPCWAEGPQKSHPKPSPDNANGAAKVVKSGVQTSVARISDCAQPKLAPEANAIVEHGTVSIKQGEGPGCGQPSFGQTEVFYTSEKGFKGADKVHLLGYSISGTIDQTFTVLVK